MRKFVHDFETIYELRPRNDYREAIVFVHRTKNKVAWWKPNHWRINVIYAKQNYKPFTHWFVLIKLPFLYFENDNSGTSIGTVNNYIWFIR